MSKETLYSPEFVAAVSELIAEALEVPFKEILSAYLEKNADQPELTQKHLIEEVLEAGGYQTEDGDSFEEAVFIGAPALLLDLL